MLWIIALAGFAYLVFFLGMWAGVAYANRQIRKKYDFFEPLLFRSLWRILTKLIEGALDEANLEEVLNDEMDNIRKALE